MSLADPELPFTALESGRASLSDGLPGGISRFGNLRTLSARELCRSNGAALHGPCQTA